MEKLFKQIILVTASIAESEKIIANIRAWQHKTAADYRELESEKKRLGKAVGKKLLLLARLEEVIQAERQKTNSHAAAA